MTEIAIGKSGTTAAGDLCRAVWRWHFYAGLLVLPFLITLSITGALYLFRDELDALIHANLKRVEIQADVNALTPSSIIAAALAAEPGTAVKFTDPADPAASAEVTIKNEQGEKIAVYVNPYDGAVLGTLADRGTVMWTIRYLHSLRYFGPVARGVIEIAGGWSILLVATGIYLWWPRGRREGVISIRANPAKRVFWRDTHAVMGLFLGGFIAFLAITGMPWSGIWGAKVNEWANGSNHGYPAGIYVDVPMSEQKLSAVGGATNWSMEQAQIPLSARQTGDAAPIGIDTAVATFNRLGVTHGYSVNLPADSSGVYTASVYPDDLQRQRIVHLDQYSGAPLLDMSYKDYGIAARALEWGINFHMGQQFGLWNQLLLLAVCLGNIVLAVSAALMWWKRRPSGKLGVPPLPRNVAVLRMLTALLAIGGIIFPLVGLSLLVLMTLDLTLTRFWRTRNA